MSIYFRTYFRAYSSQYSFTEVNSYRKSYCSINQIFVYSYHLWHKRRGVNKSTKKSVNKLIQYSQSLKQPIMAKNAQTTTRNNFANVNTHYATSNGRMWRNNEWLIWAIQNTTRETFWLCWSPPYRIIIRKKLYVFQEQRR